MPNRRLVIPIAAALAAWLSAAPARAAEGDTPAATLRQEIAGLELAPISLGTARSNLGIGVALRLGRHRWPNRYWTPIQAGVYAGGEGYDKTILVKLQTEAGAVLHTAAGALELGFGLGAGILVMETEPYGCDGSCGVGGQGLMLSPVVRLLFWEGAHHTLGTFVRAEVPAGSEGESFHSIRGSGMMVLFGLDLAGGLS